MQIKSAVVLVTGATGGIGTATALALAERGACLVLTGRDRRALDLLAARTSARVVVADLESAQGVSSLSREAGTVDVLVNNAGLGWCGQFAAMPSSALDELMAVDLLAPLRLTREVLPGMVDRQRGHIVFVSSVAGHVGVGREAVYSAAKGALNVFADALRFEVAAHGVSVTVVSPGPVRTAFFERRGVAYGRRWPAPVSAARVAAAIVASIERDRADAFVPAWLRTAAAVHGVMPSLYRRLAPGSR